MIFFWYHLCGRLAYQDSIKHTIHKSCYCKRVGVASPGGITHTHMYSFTWRYNTHRVNTDVKTSSFLSKLRERETERLHKEIMTTSTVDAWTGIKCLWHWLARGNSEDGTTCSNSSQVKQTQHRPQATAGGGYNAAIKTWPDLSSLRMYSFNSAH